MSRLNRVAYVVFIAALLAVSCHAYAQKGNWVKPATRALVSSQLDRTVLKAAKRPDIRLSVARLDHAILLNTPQNKRPHATAFLFTTSYKKQQEVWAVTAGHNAQLNESLQLTFYNGDKEILVDGTLVQQGPALLSDAALIKIDTPLPAELRPLELSTEINPQESLTMWGYAFNNFYQLNGLTLEKDNTRFLRTNFPDNQHKRSGLCGGPLLNAQGKAVGIHCGTNLDDKSYAASVRIIRYLLQAYYEGSASIPIIAKGIYFGSIDLNDRILFIQNLDEHKQILNQQDVYEQLHQSLLMELYQAPQTRYLRFGVVSNLYSTPTYRVLVYDKKTGLNHIESLRY